MQQWESLACASCESKKFVRLMELRVHPTGGSAEAPGGWQCAKCGHEADHHAMLQASKVKLKQRELAQMQAELAAQQTQSLPTPSDS